MPPGHGFHRARAIIRCQRDAAFPFRHPQQPAIAGELRAHGLGIAFRRFLRGIMEAGDVNQFLPQQFQRGAAATWKHEQTKAGGARIFRREQPRRRIATRHDQRGFRRRTAVTQNAVLPDAVVRRGIQIHCLDRIEQATVRNFRLPITAGFRARRPGPLRSVGGF